MPRLAARALWFLGICVMLLAWKRDSGMWFAVGAYMAWRGSSELATE